MNSLSPLPGIPETSGLRGGLITLAIELQKLYQKRPVPLRHCICDSEMLVKESVTSLAWLVCLPHGGGAKLAPFQQYFPKV